MFKQFKIVSKDFSGPVLVTGAGGCIGRLSYVSDVNPLIAIEAQRHFGESIVSNSRDEADLSPEPGATHRLIRPFAATVHAIACAQEGLARAGQVVDLHGQSGCVAADDGDSRNAQRKISEPAPRELETRKPNTGLGEAGQTQRTSPV